MESALEGEFGSYVWICDIAEEWGKVVSMTAREEPRGQIGACAAS